MFVTSRTSWSLLRAGGAEASLPALRALGVLAHHLKIGPLGALEYQLCDALARVKHVGHSPAVPQRHHHGTLIVRVDDAGEIGEHDAVFKSHAGSGVDESHERGISYID